MSLVTNQTQWIHKNVPLLTASSPFTSGWYNAEMLNGAQFFLQYTGSANVTIDIQLSPCMANAKAPDPLPGSFYEEFEALASGANGAEGFFDPPAAMDRPFQSYRVILTTDANITAVGLAICQNGSV